MNADAMSRVVSLTIVGWDIGGQVPHEGIGVGMQMLMPKCAGPDSPGAALQLTPPSGLCFVQLELNWGLSWGLAMIPPLWRIACAN